MMKTILPLLAVCFLLTASYLTAESFRDEDWDDESEESTDFTKVRLDQTV